MIEDKKFSPPAHTYGGLLTKAFREILFSRGKLSSLHTDITSYILRSRGEGKVSSSIYKNVEGDEMTWKSFLWMLFNIQNIKKLELKIKITHSDDSTSEHELSAVPKDGENAKPVKEKKKDDKSNTSDSPKDVKNG